MSAIRPDLPAVRPRSPDQTAPAPALRQAQAAFFRAALGEVQTASVVPTPTAVRATAPASAPAADSARPLRPGSLLDIKV